MSALLGPRVVIAGTHSGVGKTTVATGLMAALRARGRSVGSAKVGPDFIDPGYHRLATGRTGRNLDPYLCGDDAVPALAARAGEGAHVLVVEGVMGLFDGLGATTVSSTAHVAALLDAPVVLVVDAAGMSASVTAVVEGYRHHLDATFSRPLAGVILNRVGSDTHAALLVEALSGTAVPVLGALRRDHALHWRDRHLGLVPVVEQPTAVATALRALAAAVARDVDLDALEAIARSAQARPVPSLSPARRVSGAPVPVAVVGGPAFSFAYPDNLERLEEAGGELVFVDPLRDRALPARVRGLYACGGFPEVFVRELAENRPLLDDVRARVTAGLVTWAECGGLLWLSQSLDGHALCGVVPAKAYMGERVTVGYRNASVLRDSPVAPEGAVLRGHEHHYSRIEPDGDALELAGRAGTRRDGWASPHLLATYLHVHLGGDPTPAEHFVARAAEAHRIP